MSGRETLSVGSLPILTLEGRGSGLETSPVQGVQPLKMSDPVQRDYAGSDKRSTRNPRQLSASFRGLSG